MAKVPRLLDVLRAIGLRVRFRRQRLVRFAIVANPTAEQLERHRRDQVELPLYEQMLRDVLVWAVDQSHVESAAVLSIAMNNADPDEHLEAKRQFAVVDAAGRTGALVGLLVEGYPEAAAVLAELTGAPEQSDPKGAQGGADDAVKKLDPAERLAGLSFEYAAIKMGIVNPEDREAYNWLVEHDIQDGGEELRGYSLPTLDTWSRQARAYRKAMGTQKNTRRAGRSKGRSIVRADQIEPPKRG